MVGQDSDIAPIDSQDSAAPAASGSQPRCQWATCTARFNSSDELLPHISKLHLSANHLSTLWTKKEIEQIQETEANMSEAGPSAQTIDPLVDSLETEEQGLVPYGPIENPSRSFYHVCRWALCTLRSFFSIDELVRHLCNDHLPSGTSNSKPHGCLWDACSERFNTFDELTDHLSEHHIGNGSSVYVCKWKDCERHGKPFAQRQKIMRHIQTHTGDKPYQCTQCNQRFSELAIMTQHIRTHTGERPYKCPENSCGKQFAIPGALTIHIRKHTGERPFKCKVNGCEKRFAESSNLTKHVRVHTGEKPFQCPLRNCGKQFARPDQVTRHQKTHADKKKQAPI
ncbi:uncharacterized protein BJ171DRAFT_427485 [Polychytrium aggregatum]|uniref:uncharacterized protein n=1 Tax=Polychytrium aggregatum TaxID=110093 RepID=UPI0022FF338C|nr:uncharacterized protein BJ171DRAFT_427485 [Polychytrium aggregatum]KAI9199621.1 hypothetical protein BJ171DRAFT_427485 [Polychytrium aggregatum]